MTTDDHMIGMFDANSFHVMKSTVSTSTTTGALRVHGGVGIEGNVYVGNITAAYLYGNGSQLTGLPSSYGNTEVATYLTTYTGNIGNLKTTGNVITTGYFIGNGSQLTGITIDATRIENGTSNVQAYSSSDIAVSVGGTANIARFTTDGITMRTGSEIRGHNVRATNGLLTNTINATSGSNISLSTIYNFSSVNNIWAANAYITTDVSVGRNLTVTGEINTSKTVTALNILNPFLLAGM
jgi:hypothetical protein